MQDEGIQLEPRHVQAVFSSDMTDTQLAAYRTALGHNVAWHVGLAFETDDTLETVFVHRPSAARVLVTLYR